LSVSEHEVTEPAARVLPRFQVSAWAEEAKAIVFVWGEVDCVTAPRLAATLADMSEQGRRHVVVDLSGVYFMDSTGLAVLAVAHKRLLGSGGGLVLAGPTPAVRRSIEITGLDQMMEVTDTPPKVASALLESTRARDRVADPEDADPQPGTPEPTA
jgi:anti-sigma B factor antagonist